MTYTVYVIDLEIERRYKVEDNIRDIAEMGFWLREKGVEKYIYELWKGVNLHSRWKFKDKKGRWGRMSTPKKKS